MCALILTAASFAATELVSVIITFSRTAAALSLSPFSRLSLQMTNKMRHLKEGSASPISLTTMMMISAGGAGGANYQYIFFPSFFSLAPFLLFKYLQLDCQLAAEGKGAIDGRPLGRKRGKGKEGVLAPVLAFAFWHCRYY